MKTKEIFESKISKILKNLTLSSHNDILAKKDVLFLVSCMHRASFLHSAATISYQMISNDWCSQKKEHVFLFYNELITFFFFFFCMMKTFLHQKDATAKINRLKYFQSDHITSCTAESTLKE